MSDYGLLTAAIALAIVGALTDVAEKIIYPYEKLLCALNRTSVCVHWDGSSS